jgi:hypothetical protein
MGHLAEHKVNSVVVFVTNAKRKMAKREEPKSFGG